jgi:uncharacterized membrane protein
MGFWIFMFVMSVLIPGIMIGFGAYFRKHAPKEINDIFGYRTTMSMKNKETWEFAHRHCGRLWWKYGWGMLLLTVMAMLFVLGKSENVIGTFGGIICAVQTIGLIASIIPTERALKRNFDQQGQKKI